ncbi:MAG: hypothetical protein R2939_15205 [Kofleriaceae bacterium]
MFWSKIWFFLVAVAAALALTFALVMPRPAERAHVTAERQRLAVACGVVNILLKDAARQRVELVSAFSRSPAVVAALDEAGGLAEIDRARADKLRGDVTQILRPSGGKDAAAPDLAILVDRRGRAVTRFKVDADDFGDTVAGRPLVDDALAGYQRDDLWVHGDQLYLMAAAPVVQRDGGTRYVGAAVIGYAVTNKLAEGLVGSLDVGIGFYVGGDRKAASTPVDFSKDAIVAELDRPRGDDLAADCGADTPFELRAGADAYTGLLARLPGEAQRDQASYTIFVERPKALGFAGTLGAARQDDLSFSSFPWLLVGGGLVIALGLGIGLMIFESDRPLRRLNADALRLAKGELPRLPEDDHRGKFGSIARSVNIHVDKIQRDAKAAKADLDQLLGPTPDDALAAASSLGGVDLLGSSPAMSAPAPSEFKFSAPAIATPTPAPPPVFATPAPTPPPARPTPPAAPPSATAATDFALPPPRPVAPPPPAGRPTPPPARPGTPPPRAATRRRARSTTTSSTRRPPRASSATPRRRPPTSRRSSISSSGSSAAAASRSPA